jgi:3',5'-cyclic AMP phosphodiesterase CpdA
VVKLAHISDLHFGRTNPAALAALTEALNREKPDVTVITGDLTQSGRRREFLEARDFLETLDGRFLAVPGNHDAPVYNPALRFLNPWSRYEEHIGDASIQCLSIGPVTLIGVNSARRAQPRLNWSYGRLSRSIVEAAGGLAQREIEAGKKVFLALHHPVALGANKAGSRIVGNGEYALKRFAEMGVSAILSGHVHIAAAAPLAATGDRILSIQAGTAVSTRERGEKASFGMLDVAEDGVSITTWRFEERGFEAEETEKFHSADGVWRRA